MGRAIQGEENQRGPKRRREQGHARGKRSEPRPALNSVSLSLDYIVAPNDKVPYRIEYKQAQQTQDDQDQYTDVHQASYRNSRRRVWGINRWIMQSVVGFGSVYVKTWVKGERDELVRGMSTRRVFRVIRDSEYRVTRIGKDRLSVYAWKG